MKSALQRIIPITVLLILWVSVYTFVGTTAASQPDALEAYSKTTELSPKDAMVSDYGDSQRDWMADYTKVIEEHKFWGVVSGIVILVSGFVLFFVMFRGKSFACMQDDEMIDLIKEAAQEGQFDRISRKEMEYIYHRGFALATHRLDDDDLIKAVNQFKAEIEKRKEAPSSQVSAGEKTSRSSCLEEAHEVDENLYEAILGERNCIYYLTKFKYFDWQTFDLQESWNWAVFFGSGIWGLYRKMYGWFLAFLGIAALSAACVMKGKYALGLIVFMVPWIAFTVYANSLYHNKMKKIIAAAQLSITDKSKLIEYLRYEGGVNIWVVWISVVLPVAGMVAAIILYMVRR